MHQEGHIESGSGYSSGPTGGRTTNTSTNRTPFGSAGTDMGSGMMGNPTMGGAPMMVGMMGLSGTEMSTMGVRSPNVNMNLPLASAIPINVNENTQNLQQIQSFPVVRTDPNGIHLHQDPVTGQMYRMTKEFHDRIPTLFQASNFSSMNNLNSENNYGGDSQTINDILSQIQKSNKNLPIKLLSVNERSYDTTLPISINSINNYVDFIDNTNIVSSPPRSTYRNSTSSNISGGSYNLIESDSNLLSNVVLTDTLENTQTRPVQNYTDLTNNVNRLITDSGLLTNKITAPQNIDMVTIPVSISNTRPMNKITTPQSIALSTGFNSINNIRPMNKITTPQGVIASTSFSFFNNTRPMNKITSPI